MRICEICNYMKLKSIQQNTNSTFHLNRSILYRVGSVPYMCLNVAYWHQNADLCVWVSFHVMHSFEVGFSCSPSLIMLVWFAGFKGVLVTCQFVYQLFHLNRLGAKIKYWSMQKNIYIFIHFTQQGKMAKNALCENYYILYLIL